MKLKSFRASRGRGEPEFRRGLRVENSTTNRLLSLMIWWLVKASALCAGGGDNFNSDEDYFRKLYNESSSFSNDSWNLKSSRFARDGGTWIQTGIKSRELYNESSSFSNDLKKRKSFRALRGWGGIILIQTRIIFENGTTNRLLSLMINET